MPICPCPKREPEVSAPHAIVITTYPGASPSEIESLVTNPLEEALSDIKDVEEMSSSSDESVSVIVIDFDVEADLERSLQKVREKVTDARKDLPDDVEDISVEEITLTDIPIILVSVVGDLDLVSGATTYSVTLYKAVDYNGFAQYFTAVVPGLVSPNYQTPNLTVNPDTVGPREVRMLFPGESRAPGTVADPS